MNEREQGEGERPAGRRPIPGWLFVVGVVASLPLGLLALSEREAAIRLRPGEVREVATDGSGAYPRHHGRRVEVVSDREPGGGTRYVTVRFLDHPGTPAEPQPGETARIWKQHLR